jgi:5-methylthioadenosine/S-adenosylhomocysteine deaminase
MTMVGGNIVVDEGKLLTADLYELITNANNAVPNLFRRRAEWLASHKSVNALKAKE